MWDAPSCDGCFRRCNGGRASRTKRTARARLFLASRFPSVLTMVRHRVASCARVRTRISMDRNLSAELEPETGPRAHGSPSQAHRLDQLEQLVHERSAELTWANERLVAALYERCAAEAQADELRKHDRATGLPNRHALEERLDGAVKTHMERGQPAAVVCIGISRLAEIRDAHGMAAADTVAREIGKRLQVAVRGSDTVARVGDNKFA